MLFRSPFGIHKREREKSVNFLLSGTDTLWIGCSAQVLHEQGARVIVKPHRSVGHSLIPMRGAVSVHLPVFGGLLLERQVDTQPSAGEVELFVTLIAVASRSADT